MAARTPKLVKKVDSHVGQRIRERRTVLGLTQEQLAKALKISYQQVQKYETGANRVSAGRLYEVATKLGVPVAFFFEGIKQRAAVEPMPHGGKSRTTIDLVSNFSEITDVAVRSTVSGLVKSLARQERRARRQAAGTKVKATSRAKPKAAAKAKKKVAAKRRPAKKAGKARK